MNHKTHLSIFAFTLATLVMLVGAGPSLAASNMLKNPGFEANRLSPKDTPDHWGDVGRTKYITSGEAGKDVHSGTSAISLVKPGNSDRWFARNDNQPDLVKGKTYTFTVYVKTENFDEDDNVRIRVLGKGHVFNYAKRIHANTQGFEKVSFNFTPDKNAKALALLQFRHGTNDKTGKGATAIFDDVSLVQAQANDSAAKGSQAKGSQAKGGSDSPGKRTPDNWYSVYQFHQSAKGEHYDGQGFWWANNSWGYPKVVPHPWTPVNKKDDAWHVWNRSFEMGDGLLLKQIRVGGEPLLAGPMALVLQTGGTPMSMDQAQRKTLKTTDQQVRLQARKNQGDVKVNAQTRVNFDGFTRFDISIDAPKGTKVEELRVNIPIRKEVAKLYLRFFDYDFGQMKNDRFSLLQSMGDIDENQQFSFRPTVWIGDHKRGMEWVCESNMDWHNGDLAKAMRIKVEADRVVLQANLIDKPVKLGGPLRYSFALLPTPTKPKRPNAWSRYITNYSPNGTPKVYDRMLKTHPEVELWTYDQFGRAPLQYGGLPLPYPSGPKLEHYLKRRKGVRQLGGYYFPYEALLGLFKNHPAAKAFGDQWKINDTLQGAWGWGRHAGLPKGERAAIHTDPNVKSFQDFAVGQQVKAINKYHTDGLYYDLQQVRNNGAKKYFGDKPVDLKGRFYLPIYGFRQTMQRIWVATKQRDPHFLITSHSGLMTPISGLYMDAALVGEGFNTLFRTDPAAMAAKGKLSKAMQKQMADSEKAATRVFTSKGGHRRQWSKDEWYSPAYYDIANEDYDAYFNQNLGYDYYMLPQVVKFNEVYLDQHPQQFVAWSRQALGRNLVHNISMWANRIHEPSVIQVYQGLFNFGLQRRDTRHLAYYNASKHMSVQGQNTDDLRMAAWTRPGRLLFVIANGNKNPAQLTVTAPLQWAELSGSPKSAVNAETGDPVNFSDDAHLRLTVPGRDFRLIRMDF